MKNFINSNRINNGLSKVALDIGYILTSPKLVMGFLVFSFLMVVTPEIVLAANPLMNNQLTQGLLSFATDVGPWLSGVSVAVGVANCGICLVRRANCDESDTKKWNDRIKNTLIFSGLAAVITGAAPPILNHYFGITA